MLDEVGITLDEYSRRLREDPGQRDSFETWWVDRQPWLQRLGYALRPRYTPGWEPSWKGQKHTSYKLCEDGQWNPVSILFFNWIVGLYTSIPL